MLNAVASEKLLQIIITNTTPPSVQEFFEMLNAVDSEKLLQIIITNTTPPSAGVYHSCGSPCTGTTNGVL
jgi:hypothetical protein